MTSANLPDLLHLACSSYTGSKVAELLLDEDTSRIGLLSGPAAETGAQHQALIFELLQTCLARRHMAVVERLAGLPAAQQLGWYSGSVCCDSSPMCRAAALGA